MPEKKNKQSDGVVSNIKRELVTSSHDETDRGATRETTGSSYKEIKGSDAIYANKDGNIISKGESKIGDKMDTTNFVALNEELRKNPTLTYTPTQDDSMKTSTLHVTGIKQELSKFSTLSPEDIPPHVKSELMSPEGERIGKDQSNEIFQNNAVGNQTNNAVTNEQEDYQRHYCPFSTFKTKLLARHIRDLKSIKRLFMRR